MTYIDRELARVKPHIGEISPLVAYGVKGFSVFNILLGLSMFTLQSTFQGHVALIGYIFNYQFWGLIFVLSGIYMLWGYLTNNWKGLRWALILMVFSKTLWLTALLFRFLGGSQNNLIVLLLWGLITYFQFGFYWYFLPKASEVVRNEN